ncbi:putative ABC transporter ATPase and permease protein [Actinoplanes missouriensis 431]|uniref:Putative ABC transporter ATPase and permease protein n=1 Tax=Actinoplanes missouriensis (strain ATCC 14538 / DSM 43046 / CBS 188.64 / JCM 3121 / NBRC 102363 / NCIMB 12654 / NRRL B-3342 / UNCC 431) TaxID=512565 RepID=I0HAY1_ACTM4|nr:thiol reductant ABC exporter subunit CydD [Actinoplanes missouriensis]BAL90168.1 putative ABC transporter ATPase and permease protein [Actinoplanes missouriensis 431]
MRPLDPRLLRYARATRAYLAATVVLGAGQAALLIAQAVLLADAITGVFLDGFSLTFADVLPLIAVVAARAAAAWLQEVAAARSAAAVKSELRRRLLGHLAALGPAHRTPAGEIATLAGHGLDALDAYFARYLPQLVLAVLVPGILLVRLVPADLIAGLTIAVTLPLIPIFMALVGMHTEAQNRRQFRLLARLSHHFLDVVAGLPTLKLFGRAKAQAGIIARISADQRRHTLRTLRTAFLSSLVLELLATLSVALVAVGIGLRLVSGELDLATALLVLILAPEAYRPLREVGANYHASAEGLAAAEEVFAVLETPLPAAGTAAPHDGAIVFSDVEVRFPGRAGAALRLDATIEPGEVVALTGASGCGKSTTLNVLLGFVAPTSGRVAVGGVPMTDFDPDAWRARIAWVPQRPHLFATSVYRNIVLAPDTGDRAAARSAAVQADADGFIRDLPLGYDTLLGDAGAGLSAGQRQRIALARAFQRDAPIVLLDEPTANLDAATAAEVMTAIRRLARGRTVVIAAHRPELIALADREINLSRPRIPVGV